MSIYDGVVMLDDTEVPVILGYADGEIRLSSGGTEIGQWGDGEFSIDNHGNGTYAITAENETLHFKPARPDLFALGVRLPEPKRSPVAVRGATSETISEPTEQHEESDESEPPKQMTLIAFYALAGTTVFLGLWALLRIVFG